MTLHFILKRQKVEVEAKKQLQHEQSIRAERAGIQEE